MTRSMSRLPLLLAACLLSTVAQAQDPSVAADAPTTTAPAPAEAAAAEATPAVESAPAAPADAAVAVAASATASTALNEKVAAAVGAPPEGKAHVVFFRPSKFVGAAIGFKVRENEVELGKLRNGNYFVAAVEPGLHQYVVHSEAKDVTRIEAEAGETYFLSASLNMGVLAGRPNLSPSDAAAFEAVLPKLKKSKPLD
jgi:hypothetical protein